MFRRRKSGWPMPRLMMSCLRGKFGRAREHGKGIFLADTVESRHGLQRHSLRLSRR